MKGGGNMKMKLEGIKGEKGNWVLAFDLLDNKGNVCSSHEYETSGNLESEISLDVYSGGLLLRLVPKIIRYTGYLTIDGQDYTRAIDDRAKEIGYPREPDPLHNNIGESWR
jgi:hypothetical protein